MADFEIETIYRARIDYQNRGDYDENFIEKVSGFAHKRKHVDVTETEGGPCWNAYFIIEGGRRHHVQRAAEQIGRYICRFKGGEVL